VASVEPADDLTDMTQANNLPNEIRVADFEYELPPELIAQTPLPQRDASRLLVLDRQTGAIHHTFIRQLGNRVRVGDLLVANNSRVLPARIYAKRLETGGRVELLLLHPSPGGCWTALARNARRLRPGMELIASPRPESGAPEARITVEARAEEGQVIVRFEPDAAAHLENYGEVPLPPYIHARLNDSERYQTVYAARIGSAAAPTAGLHFTPELIGRLAEQGVGWVEVTLHVGLDTFRPVIVDRVADHRIHTEWCEVPDATARLISVTRKTGGRVVAVGTTSARTLETLGHVWDERDPKGFVGPTDLFITPGYQWRVVDALLTNFHLPRSTLLMMVSALAGWENIRRAYEVAVAERYRFFSFGDAMLII
jgi:S-adenosylmethionine:tRNA ribosyltransferase-isomerase